MKFPTVSQAKEKFNSRSKSEIKTRGSMIGMLKQKIKKINKSKNHQKSQNDILDQLDIEDINCSMGSKQGKQQSDLGKKLINQSYDNIRKLDKVNKDDQTLGLENDEEYEVVNFVNNQNGDDLIPSNIFNEKYI